MAPLTPCRWREVHQDGTLQCNSVRFIAPPNHVSAGFCGTCCYADHEPVVSLRGPHIAHAGGPSSIAVATLYTPEIADYGALTAGVLTAYARRHGYSSIVATAALDGDRPPSWSKLLLVERYLLEHPECQWILWIDADALITNPTRRIESLLDNDTDFLAAEDLAPSPMNMGVFLARNCPSVLDLLRRAYRKVQYLNHPWWEQPAVVEALGESGKELRTRIVPRRLFNLFPGEHQSGNFVLHFAGSTHEEKLQGIRKAVLASSASLHSDVLCFNKARHPSSMDLSHNVFLAGCVLSKKPVQILELGIGPAYISWALIRALAYNGKGKLTCVDCFADWNGNEPDHIEGLRLAGVEVIATTEESFVRDCSSGSFDMLISDADHGHTHEWLEHQLRIVKPGGFLFFHDTNNSMFPNLRAMVTQVQHLPHYHFVENSRADENCSRGFLFVIKVGTQ